MKTLSIILLGLSLSACSLFENGDSPQPNGVRYSFSNGSQISGFFRNSTDFVVVSQPTTLRLTNPDGSVNLINLNNGSFSVLTDTNQHKIILPQTISLDASNNFKDSSLNLVVGQITVDAVIILSRDLSRGVIRMTFDGITYADNLASFSLLKGGL